MDNDVEETESPEPVDGGTEVQDTEEPDFGEPEDAEAEARDIEALTQRNRRRILIPLVLLIALTVILSFFGDPIKTDKTQENTGKTGKKATETNLGQP